MFANNNVDGCSARDLQYPQHQHHHQQQEYQQLEEGHILQFSPFSSLPGLARSTATASELATAHNTTPSSHGDAAGVLETPSAVHVTRAVFTVRAGHDSDSPRLTEKLDELEALKGLVTLSTEGPTGEREQEALPGGACNPLTQLGNCPTRGTEPCNSGEGTGADSHNDALKAQGIQVDSHTGNPDVAGLAQHNHEPAETSTLNKEKKGDLARDITLEPDLSPRLLKTDSSQVSKICNGLSSAKGPTSTSFEDTHINNFSPSESLKVRDSFTQTNCATFPPTVDFYLWENRRLACNGWGVHGQCGYPSLPGGVYGCWEGKIDSPLIGDNMDLSSYETKLLADSFTNTSHASTAAKPVKTVNFATQTRSPSIKPSSLQINKIPRSFRAKDEFQTIGDLPVNTEDQQQNKQFWDQQSPRRTESAPGNNTPAQEAEIYSHFDSKSTTPRACDKTHDGLDSSRSTSILSDSGTSSSIPSAIYHSAKPFTNRMQQQRAASSMAAVNSDPLSTVTSRPVSGSQDLESPHSTSEGPTLKVEYVTKVWDAYISDFLVSSDHIKDAAIFDRATATCIASSFDFLISREEFKQLQRSLSSLNEATKMGVTIVGKHYKTYLADGRRGLMAKGAERSGCSACQTRTLVIVAVHDHTGKPARCNEEVMRLGDFFWAKGL